MTRKSKPLTAENESRMLQAIDAVKKKVYTKVSEAACTFNVPQSTLRHRVKGRQSRRQNLEQFQNLSSAEEEELVRWISKLTIIGYAPNHTLLQEMAEVIRRRRSHQNSITPTTSENDILHQSIRKHNPFGKDWVRQFLKRHPELKTVVGKKIELARIEGTLPEVLQKWFEVYHEEVDLDLDVLLKNVYNMDESGFSIGTIKAGHVIVNIKFVMDLGLSESKRVICGRIF